MSLDDIDSPTLGKDDPFGLCGTTIADKYRIDSLVGSGGFGVVYRGEHMGFAEPIAVKCLKLPGVLSEEERTKFLARLQDEGRVLHRLSKLTSGIVQALDVGAVTTRSGQWVPYLVIEWLEGQTLAKLLHERRLQGRPRFSIDEAIDLLQPAAEALAIAHRQKVAHRDVKPENVVVTEIDGRRTVKLLDFGIAKVLTHHANFVSAATQVGASAFTPSYGAPEQFNKKRGATGPWTDVFALALILVELLTGERALEGDDATQLYIASADPASRPTPRQRGVECGDAIEEVIATALAVDPADRHADAEAFWSRLRQAAGRSPLAVDPASDAAPTVPLEVGGGFGLEPTQRAAHDATTVREPTAASRMHGAVNAPHASTRADASRRRVPIVPFVIGLSLAGAGALVWQLQSVGPSARAKRTTTTNTTGRTPRRPSVTPSAGGSASASTAPSASASAGDVGSDGGHGGSGGSAPTPTEPPAGMVRIAHADGRAFFLDRTEVSTKQYLECVMAGRCKKATRVVLTEESARALGVPDAAGGMGPEQLAAAWEPRCNQSRSASDHPINCVGFGSAEDFCQWRGKRLPTSSEWSRAATMGTRRRHPWGEATAECSYACVGLNGSCVSSAPQVASCPIGARTRDATPEGVLDLGGNLAEWVSDESAQSSGDGPRWRTLRGGSFLDEPSALDLAVERAAPPVTAYVSIGFRCATDAP